MAATTAAVITDRQTVMARVITVAIPVTATAVPVPTAAFSSSETAVVTTPIVVATQAVKYTAAWRPLITICTGSSTKAAIYSHFHT